MIDLIGDIHGYAGRLERLLLKLGYEKKNRTYAHPERTALFVGDYIDRGPEIPRTLELVRSMVETDSAIALLGNHEYNALCFHYENKLGGHLRKHNIKNIGQYYSTLEQFKGRQAEYEEYLKWFMTLPLYYEGENFKAVHACWDNETIEYLRRRLDDDRLTKELLKESIQKGGDLFQAVNQTLKGKEIPLPDGGTFLDKDGNERRNIRIKWWEDPLLATYKSISVVPRDDLPEETIDVDELNSSRYYRNGDKKVFFGHYWLRGEPSVYRDNVCCLDYSVAKGGKLVAYRLGEEKVLTADNFVAV